jgi:membrane-bound lytic murein transglycosylase D
MDYVPKILAAMMIAKAPGLYGFRDIEKLDPLEYDTTLVPGGIELSEIANHIGVTHKALKDLNAELVLGYVPSRIERHLIRVPKGSLQMVSEYLTKQIKR